MIIFEKCFNSSSVMLLIDSANGEIVNANKAALDFYGYEYDEITSLHMSDIDPLSTKIKSPSFSITKRESQHRCKDQTIRDIILFSSLIDYKGRKINWAIIQDLTNEKRLSNELNIFYQIANESRALISIAQMDRKVTFLNQSMRKAFDIPENANLLNFEIQDFYSNKGKIVSKIHLSESKKKDFWIGENEMQKFDGTKIRVMQSGNVINDHYGNPAFTSITSIDITEMRQLEINALENDKIDISIFDTLNGLALCKIIYRNGIASDLEYCKVNKAFEDQTGLIYVHAKRISQIGPLFFQKDTYLIERCIRVSKSRVGEKFDTYSESLDRWFSISLFSSKQDYVIISIEVINERKEYDKKIYKLSKRYQTLLEVSNDGIHVIDKKGNIIEVNTKFCKMLGYSKETLLKSTLLDIDANFSNEELQKRLLQLIKNGEIIQTKHRRVDGTIIDVEINAIGVNLDGVDYLYASSRDITLQLKEKNNRIEALDRLNKIASRVPGFIYQYVRRVDGSSHFPFASEGIHDIYKVSPQQVMEDASIVFNKIYLDDIKGVVESIDDSASQFYGYERSELQRMKITDINVLDQEELKVDVELSVHAKRDYFIHKLSNGALIPVEVYSTPILINGSKIMFSIIHNISERVKNEELVKLYTNKLEIMNSDLESFAYVASHDLKAPLNVVNGLIELLIYKNSSLEFEKQMDYFQHIKSAINQMKMLISELLQFSLIGNNTDSFVDVDVKQLISNIQGFLADKILLNQAEFIIHTLPIVKANKTLFNELFMNLIGNALMYHTPDKPLIIEIGFMEKNSTFEFYVKDNGIGIAPENLEKVFIMFKRLNAQSEFKGTGIGLSLCKKIVESHHGKIWVESVIGEGSTFYFSLKKWDTI